MRLTHGAPIIRYESRSAISQGGPEHLHLFEFALGLVAIVTAGSIITTIVKTVGAAFARPHQPKAIAA